MEEETSEETNKVAMTQLYGDINTRDSPSSSSSSPPFFVHMMMNSPCNCFNKLMRAVLKCLGLESHEVNNNKSGSNVVEGSSGSTDHQQGDSSSSSSSAAADPPAATAMARAGRQPPRQPIGGGRGPQTN